MPACSHATVYGGVGQGPQVSALARGLDILVATPGRLLDLMQQGHLRLDAVEIFVLDEADRMLDMGFLPDVRRVVQALPKQRQTLFFSATMPADIGRLVQEILADPVARRGDAVGDHGRHASISASISSIPAPSATSWPRC